MIRKDKEGTPQNELARFFRRINICEFKSYEDKLNVLVYNKTMSYAYDYLMMINDKNGIEDVTLTFLREGWPKELMKWLEAHGHVRLNSPKWVARYRKAGCPDLQIVNIVYPDAPLFLHVLSHKAELEDIFKVSRQIRDMPDEERMKVRLVMNLSYRINGERGGDGFFETFVDPLNEVIKQKDEELRDKDEALRGKDEALRNKDEALRDKDVELEKKDAEIARLKAQLAAVGM